METTYNLEEIGSSLYEESESFIQEDAFGYYIDEDRLKYAIDIFKTVVSARSIQRGLPVRFDNGYLKSKEGYKSKVFNKGRKALAAETWKSSDIGSGKIIRCMSKACFMSEDLIYEKNPSDDPNLYLKIASLYEVESALYSLYSDPDEERAFERLVNVLGNRINLIAYLFFLKDRERFIPCRPGLIADRFRELHIQTDCLAGTSWRQYQEYNQIMSRIRDCISESWHTPTTLLNAFSFALQLSLIKEFIDNEDTFQIFLENNNDNEPPITDRKKISETEIIPDYDVEEEQAKKMSYIELHRKAMERSQKPVKRKPTLVPQYYRDSYVKEIAKRRAQGVCTLCGQTLDYFDSEGRPYLESHHIVPLNEGGADSHENVAALCPNCHMRMHHTNDKSIVEFLKQKVKEQCRKEQDVIARNNIDEKLWESRDVDSAE